MREARRRREIKDYYLAISADEITSYLTPASFDLWASLARYRQELQLGARWLELGGGMGDLAAAALERGYDVLMTDVQEELLATAATRHPGLRGRVRRADVFDARDVRALAAHGPFAIVAALGAVLNHARDRNELARGFTHLVELTEPGALLVVDLMLSEMFPGHPASIWADMLHVMPSFAELAPLLAGARLHLLEAHSLYHRYPPTPAFDAPFDERMLRLFLRKPPAPAAAGPAASARRRPKKIQMGLVRPPARGSRRARPGSRRPAPGPAPGSAGARRASPRRRRA
jgi:hypothetical protein